jgi:hypothetical protein
MTTRRHSIQVWGRLSTCGRLAIGLFHTRPTGKERNHAVGDLVSEVGQAILPADWLSSQPGRLKGGSGHDWPLRQEN